MTVCAPLWNFLNILLNGANDISDGVQLSVHYVSMNCFFRDDC